MNDGRKLIGAVCLTLGGYLLGLRQKRGMERRAEGLFSLCASLGLLEEELSLLKTPLPALFARLSESAAAEQRAFFRHLSENAGTLPFAALWRDSLELLPVGAEAAAILRPLGGSLGRYDAERQAAETALARRRLYALAERESKKAREKGGVYPGLGLCLGAMLSVVLF